MANTEATSATELGVYYLSHAWTESALADASARVIGSHHARINGIEANLSSISMGLTQQPQSFAPEIGTAILRNASYVANWVGKNTVMAVVKDAKGEMQTEFHGRDVEGLLSEGIDLYDGTYDLAVYGIRRAPFSLTGMLRGNPLVRTYELQDKKRTSQLFKISSQ